MTDKDEVEQGSNYKVSDQSLKKVDDLLNRDKEDESLKKWKEQLLGNALSANRKIICEIN